MRRRQEAAQKNLDNIYLHPDYVTQQNIVFSLAGKVMEATDKKIVTTRICQQLQEIGGKVESFPFNPDILSHYSSCSSTSRWPLLDDPGARGVGQGCGLMHLPGLCKKDGHN